MKSDYVKRRIAMYRVETPKELPPQHSRRRNLPYVVYALMDGKEPFYIGMGSHKRPRMHLHGGSPSLAITERVAKCGGGLDIIKILATFATRAEALSYEARMIRKWSRIGQLLNNRHVSKHK